MLLFYRLGSVFEVSQNENMFSELEMLGENIQVGVHSIEENGMTMEFDLISTTPPFANALRRVLLVEVRAGGA